MQEPITITIPEEAVVLVKVLESKVVYYARKGDNLYEVEEDEYQKILKLIAEHPDWDDYQIASQIIDDELAEEKCE